MPRLTSPPSTKLSSLVVLPVSPESRSLSPTSSTERSPTSPLTLTKPLPTVLPSRLLSCLVTLLPSLPTRSSSWTLPRCLSVSRLLVVS
ncbi:hypothetical protein EMPG_16642 [Blastomyces silverae]|uniref:Uncharacterized protein n=1 Tax=Blastomyces silverae TaxID=2060906 RepID=A0A0H1BFD6_9EURO|nr:hypothetical protein EMPG_16642 [Blastomyces silverae]